ncbi:MAG TPA: 4a-hydroxytetrahydrobiopterin dehydratase [Tepidisphaeraceae bacterium]|nr:4a-hydroxytetrahydrobiopterin dehydratase [Tepidisphaeraceae bacterium]
MDRPTLADLAARRCRELPPGTPPVSRADAAALLGALPGWEDVDGGAAIRKAFTFDDYHRTMAFVNAVAWVAHRENHHPDLEVGYGRCVVRYSTHSVGGLSENDFACAAKVERLTT